MPVDLSPFYAGTLLTFVAAAVFLRWAWPQPFRLVLLMITIPPIWILIIEGLASFVDWFANR